MVNQQPALGTVMVVCSVLRAEVEKLWQQHWPHLPLRFQDSMLHMRPTALANRLDMVVEEELQQGHRVVLIYGDCCPQMTAFASRQNVARTRGNNCCDLLLGREEYQRMARQGAFFLLPEWTHRWQEIFTVELGLNHENAADLMRDMHRKLVYLDTGVTPVPTPTLQACSAYCGLPCEVLRVCLTPLRDAIEDALLRLHTLEASP